MYVKLYILVYRIVYIYVSKNELIVYVVLQGHIKINMLKQKDTNTTTMCRRNRLANNHIIAS